MELRSETASLSPNPPSSPTMEVPSGVETDVVQSESDKINYSAIKLECERALTSRRRTDAMRLIKDTCQRHESSALAHHCQAKILVEVAELMDNSTAKHALIKHAIDSAKKALSLSPNSLKFPLFYANLLLKSVQGIDTYDEVAKVCSTALNITNPMDPAYEGFQEEQTSNAEGRIATVREELRSCREMAGQAWIEASMVNLRIDDGQDECDFLDSVAERFYEVLAQLYANKDYDGSRVDLGEVLQKSLVREGDSEALKPFRAEDTDRRTLEADMEKALCQRLDTYQSHLDLPLASKPRTLQNILDVGDDIQNRVGKYDSFLNVMIQSLWNLREFRERYLNVPSSHHVHVGDPCVVCALYDGLDAFSKGSLHGERDLASLKVALSNLYSETIFFPEGQMYGVSEVSAIIRILECLHKSDTSASVKGRSWNSWVCFDSCTAHSLFGMNIFGHLKCHYCGLESRYMLYTSYFHHVNARSLRTMKAKCPVSALDDLLNLVEMNHHEACDHTKIQGLNRIHYLLAEPQRFQESPSRVCSCGILSPTLYNLSTPPQVFILVIGWKNTTEDIVDVAATLESLNPEIDISVLYPSVYPKKGHHLVSVVCYLGQFYRCFVYITEEEQWIMYGDKTVEIIGIWEDVIAKCKSGHLQPLLLFFEAVH